MPKTIKRDDLVLHFLNVGCGDTIVIEFPEDKDGKRYIGVVDCYKGAKTFDYLGKLKTTDRSYDGVAFICATHPHSDHIAGIQYLLDHLPQAPLEFWDSGFRHNSLTYKRILEKVYDMNIPMKRISAGMEWYWGKVRVTALSPSVSLRNQYATYGIDMNNASIVLRIEHCKDDAVIIESLRYEGNRDPEIEKNANPSVVILGGDAEFAAWAQISQDYPCRIASDKHKPLVNKMLNLLNCGAVKVSHHGSMHSSSLDVYELMSPQLAIISAEQKESPISVNGNFMTRNLFPHQTTILSLQETKAKILTTDGSYETLIGDGRNAREGTIVLVVGPGKKPKWMKLDDGTNDKPDPPNTI